VAKKLEIPFKKKISCTYRACRKSHEFFPKSAFSIVTPFDLPKTPFQSKFIGQLRYLPLIMAVFFGLLRNICSRTFFPFYLMKNNVKPKFRGPSSFYFNPCQWSIVILRLKQRWFLFCFDFFTECKKRVLKN